MPNATLLYSPEGTAYRIRNKRKRNELIATRMFTETRITPVPVAVAPQPPSHVQASLASVKPVEVSINYGAESDLRKIPGVGSAKAKKIVATRPFNDPGDLLDLYSDLAVMNIKTSEGAPIKLDFSYDSEDFKDDADNAE